MVIEAVREHFGTDLPMKLLLGGLRPGTTEPMDEVLKETIRDHWKHVEKATGQPFDFGFFEREKFIYDTEPSSKIGRAHV